MPRGSIAMSLTLRAGAIPWPCNLFYFAAEVRGRLRQWKTRACTNVTRH